MKLIQKNTFIFLTIFLLSAFVWPHVSFSRDVALDNGIAWLVAHQNQDNGTWGSDTVRETATVVDALKVFGETGTAYNKGVGYLDASKTVCTDQLSRKIISLSGAGHLLQTDSASLNGLQNPDGGFGFAAGWPSSVADSLVAAQALTKAGITDQQVIGRLLYYLTGNQNTDGSFGFISGEGNLYLTAYAAQVLSEYLLRYANLKPCIVSAIKFVSCFKQDTEGNISFISPDASPVLTTAVAARALIATGGSAMDLLHARRFLLNHQKKDIGSWDDDPVATALALQALWQDDSQEENPDNGSIPDPGVPRPNLTIDANSIHIFPATPADGELATVTFTILNTGSAAAQHVDVALYAESPLISGATAIGRSGNPVEMIAPEESVEISISWRVVRKTGREAVYLFADPDNTVNNESNKNDNIVSSEFTVSAAADLSINPSDITFDNPAPFAGEAFTMSARIGNIGEADAGPVTVNVYKIDAQSKTVLGTLHYAGIAGGSFAEASINLRLNAGTYAFEIEALPVDAAPANNSAHAGITVQAADFRGIDLSVSASEIVVAPENPAFNAFITIKSVIRNLGDQDANNVTVTMYDGDPNRQPDPNDPEDKAAVFLASWTFNSIIGGGYKSVSTQRYGCLQPGDHDIYVVINAAAGELSRINNTAHKSVTVYPPEHTVQLSITADNITFSPEIPELGEQVAITCNFRNDGDLAVRNLKVRAYEGEPENGGVALCPEVLFPRINPHSTNTLTINKDTSEWGGVHEIYVILDPDNATADTNKNDNRASKQFYVGARQSIDLAVVGQEITAMPSDPVWGAVIQLNCPVHNYGDTAAQGALVEFYNGDPEAGGTLIDNYTIETPVQPGDTISAHVQWDTSGKSGEQTNFVRVSALPAGTPESNIFNNTASKSLTVKAPDLSIQSEDISFAPAMPLAGEALNILCRVRNIGMGQAGGYTLTVYKNSIAESSMVSRVSKPGIAAGDSDNVSFQWTAPSAEGPCKMYVVVQPDVPDANSSNNTAVRTLFTTTPIDLSIDNASITAEPGTTAINDAVTVRAEIHNNGGIDAEEVAVGFYDGVPAVDNSNRIGEVHSIDVGGHSLATIDKTIFLNSAGSHKIYVAVNRDRLIHESSYSNNQASVQVFASPVADLSVQFNEIDISPASPEIGDNVTISAIVRNHGSQSFNNVMVRFYDGDPATGSSVLMDYRQANFASYEAKNIAIHYDIISGGVHEIWVDVEAQAGEAETGNNRAYRTVNVASQEADLTIYRGQLSFSPMHPRVGEIITIKARVTNYGETAADNVCVLFYEGLPGSPSAALIEKKPIGAIMGKASAEAEIFTVLPQGPHAIYAVIETSVQESNPNNNIATTAILVSPFGEQGKKLQAVSGGSNWLVKHQHINGGWQTYDSLFNNACVLRAFALTGNKNSPQYMLVKNRIYETQATNGSWGGVVATAYSVIALLEDGVSSQTTPIINAINWLKNTQYVNGSWSDSPTQTGAAVMALVRAGVDKDSDWVKTGKRWLISAKNLDGFWGESAGYPSNVLTGWWPIAALAEASTPQEPVDPDIFQAAATYCKNNKVTGNNADLYIWLNILLYANAPANEISGVIKMLQRSQDASTGKWLEGGMYCPAVATAEAVAVLWKSGQGGGSITKGINFLVTSTKSNGDVPPIYEIGDLTGIASLALHFSTPNGFITEKQKAIDRLVKTQLGAGSWYNFLAAGSWDGGIAVVPPILYAMRSINTDVIGETDAIARAATYLEGKTIKNQGWPGSTVLNMPSAISTTCWSLLALKSTGRTFTAPVINAIQWLRSRIQADVWGSLQNNALAVIALKKLGHVNEMPDNASYSAVNWIKQEQKFDGMWEVPGSSISNASWALIALAADGQTGIEVAKGVNWLLAVQNQDGGWAAYPGILASNTNNTAMATWALAVSQYTVDIDLELLFNKPYYYPGDAVKMVVNQLSSPVSELTIEGSLNENILLPSGPSRASSIFQFADNESFFSKTHILSLDHLPDTDMVGVTARSDNGSSFGVVNATFIVKNGEGAKPDPAVLPENISFISSAPHEREPITIQARITNKEVRDAVNVSVACYDGNPNAGGRLIDNVTIERVYGLDGVDVAFAWQAAGGEHEIYIVLKPDQAIGDLNEGNNQAYKTLSVEEIPAGADLVVYAYEVTAEPAAPLEGQTVTLHAAVRNIGGSMSATSKIRFSDGTGAFQTEQDIPAIAAGGTAAVAVNWPSLGKTGRNYVHIFVNPEGPSRIAELRYDNNETVRIIDVDEPILPNLSIRNQDISFSPLNPLEAEPVEIRATVTNWGAPAGVFSVRFYYGEPEGNHVIGESYVYETLYFGQSITVSTLWDAPRKTAGEHKVYVKADPDDEIAEFSETDNIAVKNLIVGSGALSVTVEPDRQAYAARDNATLRITISSLDGSSHTAAFDVVIKDGSGAVAGSLVSGKQVAVDGAALAAETVVWNTGALPSGSYTACAVVHEGDTVQATGAAGFSIISGNGLGADVVTDRTQYYAHEKVAITASVRNDSLNDTFTGLWARLRIVNAAGDVLHTDNSSIAFLAPLQIETLTVQWSTAELPPGMYTAVLEVSGGATALSDNATFSILPSQAGGKSLQGAVSISPEQVHAGDTATLAWRITNTGNTVLSDVAITLSVMDAAAQRVVDNASAACSLGIGSSCNGTKTIDTANLPPGDYVIILSAAAGGVSQTLAFARFSLVNQCPAADAGADMTAYIGTPVILDGSLSSDADNDSLTYSWVLTDPQGSLTPVVHPAGSSYSFTPDRHGQYLVDLVVNDGFCDSTANRVIVTILNRLPVAKAGPDQVDRHIGDTITLAAEGSSDPDGDAIAGWEWTLTKPDGSSGQPTPFNSAITAFVADMKGQYRAILRVFDGMDWSTADEVVVTVVNRCPVAEAGSDRLALVGEPAAVDGRGSFDLDADTITYLWALVGWPAGSRSKLDGADERACSITPDRRGDYILELVVRDGVCPSAADRVIVSTENRRPTAEAGSAQLGHVGDTITLDAGLSSDPDNDTLQGWQWEFVQPLPAGSAAQLTAPDALSTNFTIDRQGEYRINLKVFDGLAWSEADEVVVSTENRCPVARAGDNRTVRIGETVTIDATASSDADNDSIIFRWVLNTPDGSAAVLDNATAMQTAFVPDMAGAYTAILIVNDGICDSQASRVTVTVVNQCPVADAGDDQSAQTGQTVVLDGSGSTDPDNDSLSYSWSLTVPQGSAAVLDNATGAHPSFIADKAGSYWINLTVNDGNCPSSPDTVTITVAVINPVTGCIEAPLPEPPCAMKTDYGTGGVSGEYKIYSYADYQQYVADNYGYKNGKYKKLKIMSSIVKPLGDLVMHSPADIEIGKYVNLVAHSGVICLDGRMGVSGNTNHLDADEIAFISEQGNVLLGSWSHVSCDTLYISAGGTAQIGDWAKITANGPVALISTGAGTTPVAEVRQGAEVEANSCIVQSPGSVLISEYAKLAITGAVQLTSTAGTPGNSVRLKPGAEVAAMSLCMSGPEDVSAGPGSSIAAHDLFIASTGTSMSGKAAIKPGTMITVYDMSLTGWQAWLEPLSHLMIHGHFYMEAAAPDGCSVKGYYWSQTKSGNCLE